MIETGPPSRALPLRPERQWEELGNRGDLPIFRRLRPQSSRRAIV
jgi:hypothetical protein